MSELPTINSRDKQRYVAIATQVTMEEFDVVDGLTDEVFAWMERQGLAPSGPPFVRIVTSDMTAKLDIEVGVPVNEPAAGDDRVLVGAIPGGTCATLFYTVEEESDHLQANADLQAWAADQGLEWQKDRSSGVETWVGRFGFFHKEMSSGDHRGFEIAYLITDDSAAVATRPN